jgi:hypothetical protein
MCYNMKCFGNERVYATNAGISIVVCMCDTNAHILVREERERERESGYSSLHV